MRLNAGPDLCSDEENLSLLNLAACTALPGAAAALAPHQSSHSALEGKVQVQLFCFCCAAGFEESSKFPQRSRILIRPVH